MSSIKGKGASDEALKFLREKLLAALEALYKRRGDLFSSCSDKSESCYVQYPEDLPSLLPLSDTLTEEALRNYWTCKGFPEFSALAGDILKLVQVLKGAVGDDKEISPYLYAMY